MEPAPTGGSDRPRVSPPRIATPPARRAAPLHGGSSTGPRAPRGLALTAPEMPTTLPPAEALAAIVSGVTETMLGLTFKPDLGGASWAHLVWRGAVMGLPGTFAVTVGLSSDRSGCETLGSRMFQVPVEELSDEMVSDCLCELVNMTAGLLKSQLDLEQALGLPRVMPDNEAPIPGPAPDRNRVVLRAHDLGLVLWVFEGLV